VPDLGSVDASFRVGCKIVQDRPQEPAVQIDVVITIHIIVDGADRASRWYQDVFGAVESSRVALPDGRLIHVELDVGGSTMMLADEFPDHEALSPARTGHISATFYLHCDDVEAVWERSLAGGAAVVRDLADTFWGEREGQITDPFGHRWGLTQHVRDVPMAEMTEMAAQAFSGS